jgi:hypothetical protein
LSAPVLTQWTSIFGLTIQGYRPPRDGPVPPPGFPPDGDPFFIRGHVESAVVAASSLSPCAEVSSSSLDGTGEQPELPCVPQDLEDRKDPEN